MSYQRRILSGPKVAAFRARHAEPTPGWVKDWTEPELAELDAMAAELAHLEEVAALEAAEQAEDEAEAAAAKQAALPAPLPLPSVRQRIKARQRWSKMWAQSKNGEDFRSQLIERLCAALEVARATHADEDMDRIMAEIAALGNEESGEPSPTTIEYRLDARAHRRLPQPGRQDFAVSSRPASSDGESQESLVG